MVVSTIQSHGGKLRKCDWGTRNPIAHALSIKNVISSARKPWRHPPWWTKSAVSPQLLGVRPSPCSHNSARTQRHHP
eukprot:scaffold1278_cov59-Cyclotella_meneghiniana.AAC.9